LIRRNVGAKTLNRKNICWRKNIEIGENLLEEKHKNRKENPARAMAPL
jgi:hypothetical protein